MTRPRTAGIAFILVTLMLSTLGVGVVIPVLPSLVRSFVHHDPSTTSRYYGFFVAVYALMQFVFAPVLGGLSDRFGRRPVLLGSVLGSALDYLLLSVAPGLGWLLVGRVISGITGASFSTATAYIADVTEPDERAKSFGLMGAVFGLGFIIGPALGGLLGGIHLRLPFLVAAGLNLTNFLYGFFVLPESLRPEHRRPFSLRRSSSLDLVATLRRHPVVLGFAGTFACSCLAQQILQSVWAIAGEGRFGWREVDVGTSLAAVGLSSAIVQGGLIRVLVPRLGERRALVLGLAVNVLGFVAFGLATRGWMMYAIVVPFALGGLANPSLQALVSRAVGPAEQGEVQGALTSIQSLTAVVAPLIGTGLYATFGPATARPHVPGAPFFLAACFHAVGLALAVRLFARPPLPAVEHAP